jgi:hypothetical protein
MNQVTHQLFLLSPAGDVLTVLADGAWAGLSYALKEDEPGVLDLVLPGDFDYTLLQIDGQIEVYRAYGGAPMKLEGDTAFFIRRILRAKDEAGTETIRVTARSALDLMQRRIVAYYAGASYTDKVLIRWDDLMREIVRENMGEDASDADRDLRPWLTVEDDIHYGASYTKSMPWRVVLNVLQEIAADVRAGGFYCTFDVVRTSFGHYEYRVFIGPRGVDHSSDSALPVVVSESRRNLLHPSADEDWQEEKNFIYATGQGQEDERVVETAQDDTRIGISPFNRQEFNRDARQAELVDSVQAEADAALETFRPKRRFSGAISQTDGCIYGVHWGWGDIVTAEYEDITGRIVSVDCHVDTVQVSIDADGTEIVVGDLRSETDV